MINMCLADEDSCTDDGEAVPKDRKAGAMFEFVRRMCCCETCDCCDGPDRDDESLNMTGTLVRLKLLDDRRGENRNAVSCHCGAAV